MGHVYRAHDARLGRDVALKVLPAEVSADPERLARFRREARAVAALNHPHIVTIFSIEEDHGVPFMTMELVEGRSLDHALTGGGLPLAQFFEIGVALADALSAAHRKGLVHRDVKPANVMVTGDGVVKVLDFGLARESEAPGGADEDAATSLGLTQAGMIVGTVPYMSPEQIEGKPVDHRSDIFSLGVVLYEMATGARPFSGGSSPALMSSILKDRPRPIADTRADVPDGVWRLVARCLEKSPRDRVQSAQDIHVELKALRRAWESGTSAPAVKPASASAHTVSSDLRVAVLPFTCRGSGDGEALADGLTDDITAGLSRFQYLRVVSRREAESAKGQSADALAAERLGARYLVEGAVRTAGTAVRLSVRLVDTTTSAHMWAENYDRPLGSDLFALQDDLAARVVATVGDTNGVLARSLAASLKDRNADELTVSELVMRFFGYGQHFRHEEYLRLRAAFERALAGEPGHALGWACLAVLYEQEYSQLLNLSPEPLRRSAEAAQRSVELDPTCQAGWRALAAINFFERDLNGLRVAAERAVALNPLHATVTGAIGWMLAFAGEWDRGVELVARAIDLNPHHPGWLHNVLATNHYRNGEFAKALVQAKRSNLPQYVWMPLHVAGAAGQLGLTADARAALDAMRRNHPAYLDPNKVRALWSMWLWDADLVDRFVEGFVKAQALVDRPADAARPSSAISPVLAAALDQPASIAVMPFSDLSAAKDQEWFCDGIAEEILNALTPLKNLRVAARASAFSLRGRSDDLKTIGEKLNVTTVLGGSVRRAGDRVRITVQLSDVRDGIQIWSERYDRELKDIFDVQDEIAKTVAERLKVTLTDTPARSARAARRARNDQRRGVSALFAGPSAAESPRGEHSDGARTASTRAVELDPDYALAWAGHRRRAYRARPTSAASRRRSRSRRRLRRRGRLWSWILRRRPGIRRWPAPTLLFENNRDLAGQEFERALELNPHYVQGRCWYALVLSAMGARRLRAGHCRGAAGARERSACRRTRR